MLFQVVRDKRNVRAPPEDGRTRTVGAPGKVFAREDEQVWQCANCGHLHVGKKAPGLCPVCAHPQAYFQIKADNY